MLVASSAWATPLTSLQQSGTYAAYPAATSDLSNSNEPTFGSISVTGAYTDQNAPIGLNGLFDGSLTNGQGSVNYSSQSYVFYPNDPSTGVPTTPTVTLTFNTGTNTAGYDVTKIQSFTIGAAYWVQQSYTVYYSTVANPSTFVQLYGTGVLGANTQGSVLVTTQDSGGTGAAMVTNVKALEFTFNMNGSVSAVPTKNPGNPNWYGDQDLWEIDVFGQASARFPSRAR